MRKSIILIILLPFHIGPFSLKAQQTTSSQIEYEKIQNMRNDANKLVSKLADSEHLVQAENKLLQALNYARSDKVRFHYTENTYLKARQWDIIRDLIQVNIFQHDKKMVGKYAMELIEDDSLSWIREFSDIDNVLVDNKEYQAYIQKSDAWERIGVTDSFASEYKDNLRDAEKLAGLANLWSETKYSFVYFDQVPELDWDKTFKQYIPKILATNSTREYYQELMKFSALLQDSHTGVYPPKQLSDKFYSKPPMSTALIEGKAIITDIYSSNLIALGLNVGDEIVKIDNQDVYTYADEKIKPYIGASTIQDMNVRLYNYMLLRGDKDKSIKLSVQHYRLPNKGGIKNIDVPRNGYVDVEYPEKNLFKELSNGIVYIALDSFSSSVSYDNFKKYLPEIIKSKGLIIDVRNNGGGTSDWGYKVLGHLTNKPIVTSKSKTRKYLATDRAWGDTQINWHEYENHPMQYGFKKIYQGKVVVLVGAKTFSAAEDFVLAFKINHLGKIVGSKTGGSSGQPLVFDLPGGGSARVCSKRDTYPDGSDWVGFGIPVDIVASRTVSDIFYKTDSVIQAAIAELNIY